MGAAVGEQLLNVGGPVEERLLDRMSSCANAILPRLTVLISAASPDEDLKVDDRARCELPRAAQIVKTPANQRV